MSEEIRVITKAQYDEYMKLKKQFVDATKKVRWKPKNGDIYFIIRGSGETEWETWVDSKWDIGCYDFHNCFETEEQAQKELDRKLAEQELLDMCDDSGVVEIGFDVDNREFCAMGEDSDYLFSPYRFATEKSCKKAIKQLGTEKLKLIFRFD